MPRIWDHNLASLCCAAKYNAFLLATAWTCTRPGRWWPPDRRRDATGKHRRTCGYGVLKHCSRSTFLAWASSRSKFRRLHFHNWCEILLIIPGVAWFLFFIFAERWQLRARSGRRQGKNSLRLAVAVGTPPRQSCRKSKTYNIFLKLVFFFQNIVLFIFYIKSAEFLYYRLGNRSQLILPVKLLSIIRSKLRYVTTSTNQTWHLHATCSNPSLSSVHSIFMNEADVLSTFIGLAMSRM